MPRAAARLRGVDETRTALLDEAQVGVVATYVGEAALWAPYRAADGSFVVLAGRSAFDEEEWSRVEREDLGGEGGLAAKVVYFRYRQLGAGGLERISGNCAAVVYDAPARKCHLVTDCSGVFPTYTLTSPAGRLYGSHPDVVAEAGNETHRLDEVSLAEFVIASTVTPPYTYYERVRFVEAATRWTFALGGEEPGEPERTSNFAFSYRGDPKVSGSELAEQLAAANRSSVRRRTLPGRAPR